jgi:hypothetical protein
MRRWRSDSDSESAAGIVAIADCPIAAVEILLIEPDRQKFYPVEEVPLTAYLSNSRFLCNKIDQRYSIDNASA